MKLLVVHAWLRGNLGDVLQASVLLKSLRELGPAALDLGGYPARPGPGIQELVELADHHVPEPFNWYWRFTPELGRKRLLEPAWRRRRRALFSRYDAIVSAPGPFLAAYDVRLESALSDFRIAAELGIPFLLANHSIGPLSQEALGCIGRAALCVARESTTRDYLARHGIDAVLSADLAFLYPYRERLGSAGGDRPGPGPYRLLFLRSNHLAARNVRCDGRTLRCGTLEVALAPDERVVLATSDAGRDRRFLAGLSRRLNAPLFACRSVPELADLVAGSTGVVTDRYHPAICAVALGKPAEIIVNHEPHKMLGLRGLTGEHDLRALEDLARTGLLAIHAALVPERSARAS